MLFTVIIMVTQSDNACVQLINNSHTEYSFESYVDNVSIKTKDPQINKINI